MGLSSIVTILYNIRITTHFPPMIIVVILVDPYSKARKNAIG